jgi:hypothetical protein
MPILCSVIRKELQSEDASGRRSMMEPVHYTNATTGRRVRTNGYIQPSNTVRLVESIASHSEPPRRRISKLAELGDQATGSLRAVSRRIF